MIEDDHKIDYEAFDAALAKRLDRCILQCSLDGEVLDSEKGLLPASATEQHATQCGPQYDRPSHEEPYQ